MNTSSNKIVVGFKDMEFSQLRHKAAGKTKADMRVIIEPAIFGLAL